MLRLNNIEVRYLKVILALKGVSLDVSQGIICLLGANGAGKSTTLKAISGLLKTEDGEVTSGSIEFEGVRIDKKGPQEIAKMGIIQILEGRRVLEHLAAEENLRVAGLRTTSSIKDSLSLVYHYFPKLKDLRTQTSGLLSGGEQQMLVIGRALMARPKLMLLDEPSLGLAPLLVRGIYEIIKKINLEQGTSMLLVEQNAKAALSLAEYGYVMENGKVVMDGPASKLADNEDVKEFYLGLSDIGKRKSYREVKYYRRRKRWLS